MSSAFFSPLCHLRLRGVFSVPSAYGVPKIYVSLIDYIGSSISARTSDVELWPKLPNCLPSFLPLSLWLHLLVFSFNSHTLCIYVYLSIYLRRCPCTFICLSTDLSLCTRIRVHGAGENPFLSPGFRSCLVCRAHCLRSRALLLCQRARQFCTCTCRDR